MALRPRGTGELLVTVARPTSSAVSFSEAGGPGASEAGRWFFLPRYQPHDQSGRSFNIGVLLGGAGEQ